MKITDKISNLIRKVCDRGPRHSALGTSVALGSLIAIATTSCSMINEDLEPCAPAPNTITTVNFVYDYNMQFSDLFNKHAGSAYLYVFDKDSVLLFRKSIHRNDVGFVDFSMSFDTTEMKPGRTYHLVGMALGNHVGNDTTLQGNVKETPGFEVQNEMIPGKSKISDYIIKLDRDEDGNLDFGVVNYKDEYGNNQQMIDTVWSTKPDEVQTIRIPEIAYKPTPIQQPDNKVNVTIPMMRLTNSIKVNLTSNSFTETTDPEAFRMLIYFPSGNGTIDFTGTVYPYQPLYYQTLRKKTIKYVPGNQRSRADGDRYAVQGTFGVSRLQVDDESSLQIRDPQTNEMIAEIPNFSKFLADAFNDSDYDIDGQEFLDREYDFEITIGLNDTDPNPNPEDNWAYIEIYIEVINWYVRINNIGF